MKCSLLRYQVLTIGILVACVGNLAASQAAPRSTGPIELPLSSDIIAGFLRGSSGIGTLYLLINSRVYRFPYSATCGWRQAHTFQWLFTELERPTPRPAVERCLLAAQDAGTPANAQPSRQSQGACPAACSSVRLRPRILTPPGPGVVSKRAFSFGSATRAVARNPQPSRQVSKRYLSRCLLTVPLHFSPS